MTNAIQKRAAQKFVDYWKNKEGYEKGQTQSFWFSLLQDVFGVKEPTEYIEFEDRVELSNTSFIDGYIRDTHVLIEQKGANKELNKPILQSDGTKLSAFEQARRYANELKYSDRPRWIVTCNFKQFYIYDMENPNGAPVIVDLIDLPMSYYQLNFLVDITSKDAKHETQVSVKAGNLLGLIYDELIKQYINPNDSNSQRSINQLCVRIVFCLYAEDAGIFGRRNMFHDYLEDFQPRFLRQAIIDLFSVLDTDIKDRDPYLDDKLAEFPYVNGGMFSDNKIEVPQFTQELKDLILIKASNDFDWSDISPTIFGSVFESTLNPITRREGGMHYTSIENIHKVIDPLFLDRLKNELNQISQLKQPAIIKRRVSEFQREISHLKFFDPACGSGNFLTETYLSLRKLENEAIKLVTGVDIVVDTGNLIHVKIQQFYGIEINDFAVSVAKTALWIAESQMYEATRDIVYSNDNFLPLKTYTNITEGNALLLDWYSVTDNEHIHYIISNPPFIGARLMTSLQKKDLERTFGTKIGIGNLDYVSGWYYKAAQFSANTGTNIAMVSTNSITQGEQVSFLWGHILNDLHLTINFAYKTFKWTSEASDKASVHVVIIGYGKYSAKNKWIFDDGFAFQAKNISPYLIDADNILVESRLIPLNAPQEVLNGSMPNDNRGKLSRYTTQQVDDICKKYPEAHKYFHRFLGATEYLHDKDRWCLWLTDQDDGWLKIKPIADAVKNVQEARSSSKRQATQILANTPYRFAEVRQPKKRYLLIPRHSSENRRYIPMGFQEADVIVGDSALSIDNISLYAFGILMSNMHMAWVRAIAGRIKSDYRYSNTLVYNNFPWPTVTHEQKKLIEEAANKIISARLKYSNRTPDSLYNSLSMPPELRIAHENNDRAVMQAYGLPVKTTTESDAVVFLLKRYQQLIIEQNNK